MKGTSFLLRIWTSGMRLTRGLFVQIRKRKLVPFISLALVSCATIENIETPAYATRIDNLEYPLTTVQKTAAIALPVGYRIVSPNGRTFTSQNFILSPDGYKEAGEALDRYVAHITVMNSERPYAVVISVDHEKRVLKGDEFVYAVVGHDSRLAKELATHFREVLVKRREDRNIIDDFRAF
jgi:hypothetical protein